MTGVSVIIPAYRAEAFIVHAVRSVLAQTQQDFEIVIASDDKQNYQAALAAQGIDDPRIHCAFSVGYGTGEANARNTALAAARGQVIVALDADDMLAPNALEILVPLALRHGAVYSAIAFTDFASGKALRNLNRPCASGWQTLSEAFTSNLHTFANLTFNRQRLPDLCWPDWTAYWVDALCFAVCCDALGGIYYESQPLYIYRRREGSLCNQPGAAEKFRHSAHDILARLNNEPSFLSHTSDSHDTLRRFFESRETLEALFEDGLRDGVYHDWQDFVSRNLGLFYRL